MQNRRPLISVIVPTHNRPLFLKKTLLSIVAQSYPHLEIIVVSNGFNPENKKVAEEIQDARICYLEQADSGGPSSPRNHGVRKSKGDYIAFCDDDDLWMPSKIEKQVTALESNGEYGLCYSKMMRFNHEKEWAIPHEEGATDLRSLLYINTVPISSVLIKKSLLEQYGDFSESKRIGTSEDYEFLLRYAAVTKFYFVDEYLIKYWSGGSRMTDNQMNISMLTRYFFQILSCYYALWIAKKIKLIHLAIPVLYNIKMFLKGCAYQLLLKMELFKI